MDKPSRNFIQQIVDADLAAGRYTPEQVHTRFPPEPNGYLHIGHAKSICLNAGLAAEFGGRFNLRLDDTNPAREEQEYVDGILEDVRWLGADWQDRLFYASDYFEQLYTWAEELVRAGHAYVCDLTAEQMREHRGTLTRAGRPSPHRDRPAAENLKLLAAMRGGEFPDGAKTLRAKIDMASPNLNLRDPVMYRIKHAHHQRTGDAWPLYPSYDWAHGQSDALEGVTHSICTLEFENHRPLYDWFCDRLGELGLLPARPRQIEFARLNLTYTVISKRKLLQLVEQGYVAGWDDPRMPTLRGLRRRGYTSRAVRAFCDRIGVAKFNSTIDRAWLEDAVREHLNEIAPRRMAVLRPLKVLLTPAAGAAPPDAPGGVLKRCLLDNHPQDPTRGQRSMTLGREVYIERDDFLEQAPKKFFRLKPGGSVRLRGAGIATCQEVRKDATGAVSELRCSFLPDTTALVDGKKVKGTIHWVDAATAVDATVRLYDHLFRTENPERAAEGKTFLDDLNPASLETVVAKAEPAVAGAVGGDRLQFERLGYFYADPIDSSPGSPVFNRTATLRDTWGKTQPAAAGK